MYNTEIKAIECCVRRCFTVLSTILLSVVSEGDIRYHRVVSSNRLLP